MADTRMSPTEREAFLADLHVGVLSIPRPSGAPLSAPVWYSYTPGSELWLLTGPESRKGKLLQPGVAVSLVAQQESLPYAYVTVEGVVTELRPATTEDDSRPMARRYLGEQMGDGYVAANSAPSVRVSIRIERWLTVDYAKA